MAYIATLRNCLIVGASIALMGCVTQYGGFKKNIRVGQSKDEVERYLAASDIRYQFVTCEEAQKRRSVPEHKCLSTSSVGLYLGHSNDGSYIFGAGSSDVAFEVEIGPDQSVTDIRTDYVYTFL